MFQTREGQRLRRFHNISLFSVFTATLQDTCNNKKWRQTVPCLRGLFPLQLLHTLLYHQAPGTTSLSWNSSLNQ